MSALPTESFCAVVRSVINFTVSIHSLEFWLRTQPYDEARLGIGLGYAKYGSKIPVLNAYRVYRAALLSLMCASLVLMDIDYANDSV